MVLAVGYQHLESMLWGGQRDRESVGVEFGTNMAVVRPICDPGRCQRHHCNGPILWVSARACKAPEAYKGAFIRRCAHSELTWRILFADADVISLKRLNEDSPYDIW